MSRPRKPPLRKDLARTILLGVGLVALLAAAVGTGRYHRHLLGLYYGARLAADMRTGDQTRVSELRKTRVCYRSPWWDKLSGLGPAAALGNRLAFSIGAAPGTVAEFDLVVPLDGETPPAGCAVTLSDGTPPDVPPGGQPGCRDKAFLRYRLGRYEVTSLRTWWWERDRWSYMFNYASRIDRVDGNDARGLILESGQEKMCRGLSCLYDPAGVTQQSP